MEDDKYKKISTTVYFHKYQLDALKALSAATRVRMADYIREGIDLILEKKAIRPSAPIISIRK